MLLRRIFQFSFLVCFIHACQDSHKEFTYYENGQVKSEFIIKGEKRNGIGKFYAEGGKLYMACTYVNDLRNGSCKTYYSNGRLKAVTEYVNDTANGKSLEYYTNGKLEWKVFYMKGVVDGIASGYDSMNGKKIAEIHYRNGIKTGSETYWLPNGKPSMYILRDYNGLMQYKIVYDSVGNIIEEKRQPNPYIHHPDLSKLKLGDTLALSILLPSPYYYKRNLYYIDQTQPGSKHRVLLKSEEAILKFPLKNPVFYKWTFVYDVIDTLNSREGSLMTSLEVDMRNK